MPKNPGPGGPPSPSTSTTTALPRPRRLLSPAAQPAPSPVAALPPPPPPPAPRAARLAELSIEEAVIKARGLAATLNQRLDELNDCFGNAEDALEALGLNVYASVRLREVEDSHVNTIYTDLVYARTSGGWGLLVEQSDDRGNEESFLLPHASKELRLLAAEKLPQLIVKLIERGEEESKRIAESVEAVRTVTKKLRGEA